jgi:hypothetical protein
MKGLLNWSVLFIGAYTGFTFSTNLGISLVLITTASWAVAGVNAHGNALISTINGKKTEDQESRLQTFYVLGSNVGAIISCYAIAWIFDLTNDLRWGAAWSLGWEAILIAFMCCRLMKRGQL